MAIQVFAIQTFLKDLQSMWSNQQNQTWRKENRKIVAISCAPYSVVSDI